MRSTNASAPRRERKPFPACQRSDPDSERTCPQRRAKVDELDAIGGHVTRLLDDPATLLARFKAYARRADEVRAGECAEE